MEKIIEEGSRMFIEVSELRNPSDESTAHLFIALKNRFDREFLDMVDKYLQSNDQMDIRIKICRKSDMSFFENPEKNNLPYVRRIRVN